MGTDDGQKLILTLVLLSLIGVGIMGLFNLGAKITPALDVSFSNPNGTLDLMLIILVRVIIAPVMIVLFSWVIYNVWTQL